MRVALVCATSESAVYQAYRDAQVDPPLGVLHLATCIAHEHTVKIFDGQLDSATPSMFAQQVVSWRPDVVGFSVNFSTVARSSNKMAEHIRANMDKVTIVYGGNYSTFNWQRLIDLPYIDYVLLHEAEVSFPQLLSHIAGERSDLPARCVTRSPTGKVVTTSCDEFIQDLDTLPHCDYTLFDDPSRYVKSIVSSRGCPYTCIYCSTKEMWNKWRCRSAENVAAEMFSLADAFSCTQILFADDTFLVRKDRALALCRILEERNSPLLWGFSTRIETIPDALVPILARAGCRWIFFGVESGSDRVLKHMNRHYTSAEAIQKVKLCAENGIGCTASFILGLPWETDHDVRMTFETMRQMETHRVLLNIFTPQPGTLSLNQHADYGIQFLEPFDSERAIVGHGYVGYRTKHLSAQQIKTLWLEGQGIVMSKGRQKKALEEQIERNRYGLLGTTTASTA